jgi:phage terminase small subunit
MTNSKELKEKHKRFADFYITSLDIAESYTRAGYKTATKKSAYIKGWNLLKKNELIKEYVDRRLKEKEERRVMKQDEILEIYTTIARSEEVATKDKLKALDSLSKINGLFIEKVQHETTIQIKLPDFAALNKLTGATPKQEVIEEEYTTVEDDADDKADE